MKSLKVITFCLALLSFNGYVFSQGKIFTVTIADPSGAGSLQAAIDSVNANPTNSSNKHKIIVSSGLASPYIVTLTGVLPDIVEPVIINGKINSTTNLILDGNNLSIKGLSVKCDYVEIKNLKFKKFDFNSDSRGIQVDSNYLVIDSCRFDTCYYGAYLNGDRNVIKHSIFTEITFGIGIIKDYNVIFPQNNLSNTDKSGTGISISANALYNRIGDEITISDSMNVLGGLEVAINDAGRFTKIYGNLIGGPSKLNSSSCSGSDFGSSNATGILLFHNYGSEVGKVGQANDNFSNIILGNEKGIQIDDGDKNYVGGNYIGEDKYTCTPTGTIFTMVDQNGIDIRDISDSNLVGSPSIYYNSYDANIISGMPDGIGIWYRASGYGNQIMGNIIGTNKSNSASVGNKTGVLVLGSTPVTIKGNVIAKSVGTGISLLNKITVEDNRIGTTIDGTGDLGNGIGISVGSSSNILARNSIVKNNLISGNGTGINIQTDSVLILGNLIGTNLNGDSLINPGSQTTGVRISFGRDSRIGGTDTLERNVISGNTDGIFSVAAAGINNRIIGNYLGVNSSGNSIVKNTSQSIETSTKKLIIGGNRLLGEGNLIGGGGILFNNADSSSIKGNYIGTNSSGANLASGTRGIQLSSSSGAIANIIGSTIPGEGNIIANYSQTGIYILNTASTNNKISGNSIYNHSVKAISLNYGANQGNNGKPVPVIDSIKYLSPALAYFKGTAEANDSIEIFSSEVTGKNAYTYIGHGKADGSGNWSFTASVSSLDRYYVATATGSSTNNTSELSSKKTGICYYFAIDTRNVFPSTFDVIQSTTTLASDFISGPNGTDNGFASVNPTIPVSSSTVQIKIDESAQNDSLRIYLDIDQDLDISNLKAQVENFASSNLASEHYSIDTNSVGCNAVAFYSEPQFDLPHTISSNLIDGIATSDSLELSGFNGIAAEIKVYELGNPNPLATLTNGGSYTNTIVWNPIPSSGLYKFILKLTDSTTPTPKVLYYKGQFFKN